MSETATTARLVFGLALLTKARPTRLRWRPWTMYRLGNPFVQLLFNEGLEKDHQDNGDDGSSVADQGEGDDPKEGHRFPGSDHGVPGLLPVMVMFGLHNGVALLGVMQMSDLG